MLLNHFPLIKTRVSEVAIADLDGFQIIVPTARPAPPSALWEKLSRNSQREYSADGWVVYRDRIVGHLQYLRIGVTPNPVGNLKSVRRLGPAVPLDFEVWSRRSLPPAVRASATLTCEFRNGPFPHCNLFRQCQPKFVRVYSFEGTPRREGVLKVRQLLIDEAEFVAENRERLKRVAFYREKFNL